MNRCVEQKTLISSFTSQRFKVQSMNSHGVLFCQNLEINLKLDETKKLSLDVSPFIFQAKNNNISDVI